MTTAPAATQFGLAAPPSPPARRVDPPRWRDKRLGVGVALVLFAIVLGARLVGAAGAASPVLVAARPLPVGHVITGGDLRIGRARLGAGAGAYWPGADLGGLDGHPLVTTVAVGDLLPRSAVASSAAPQPTRAVSLPVDPARVPRLSPGDLVDVFATGKDSSAAGTTVAVLRGVRYLGGADTGSGATVSVRLEVPVAQTAAAVRAGEVDVLDVVLQQPAGDNAGDVGTTPLS